MTHPAFINNQSDFNAIMAKAMNYDAVGLDTEFVWERTYFPQLGLIQLALSDQECYAIDPLAINDISPLGELLEKNSVVKIFHDAPQDLAILKMATGIAAQNIFDTRLAAGFAGLPSTISLSALIQELLETTLNKEATRTNWLARPLSNEQLSYALDDVRYLRAARVILLGRIIGPQVKMWLTEELGLLNNPHNYNTTSDHKRYKKIKGINRLSPQGLAIAKQLCIWREEVARKSDRPRGHVLKDDVLMDIAEHGPTTIDQLEATSISKRALDKYADLIIEVCCNVLADEAENYPQPAQKILLNTTEKDAYDTLKKLITLKSDVLGIDPALLGNTNELKSFIKIIYSGKPSQMRQTAGWRKNFLEGFYQLHRKAI